jgi:hypothetical protein
MAGVCHTPRFRKPLREIPSSSASLCVSESAALKPPGRTGSWPSRFSPADILWVVLRGTLASVGSRE